MRVAGNQVRAVFLLVALLFIAACGGAKSDGTTSTADTSTAATTTTGTDTGTGTAVAAKVTLSGSVSGTLAKPSSKPNSIGTGTFHSPMSGGDVKVIDSTGVVVGTGTIASDGTYSVSVDKGSNYVMSATKGNVCLKSYVETADVDKTVTVDPTSSAIVKVLGIKIGNDKLGDEGQDVSSVIGSTDIAAIIVAINNSGLLATIAQAIQTDISTNANYSSTTVTVGAASTAGNSEANTVSLSITITITIVVNGSTVTAPSAPTGVALTIGDGQLTVSWNAVTGATSYNLYYSTVQGVAGIKINGITPATSYTLTGLNNGATYYFQVTASNTGMEGLASTVLSGIPQVPAPGAPTGATGSAGDTQATLSWTAVTGATSYNIYYRTTVGVNSSNGTKITSATSPYIHTGLTNNTTYYYVVTAENGGGESAVSSEVNVTPNIPAPSTPSSVTVTAGDGNVTLNWTAVTTATSYNAYYRTTTGVTVANGTKITGIASGGQVASLTNGTTYYFVITAVNAGGESTPSGGVSATPATVLASGLATPWDIAVDATSVYWTDNLTVSKVPVAGGTITTLLSSGASLNNHRGLAVDATSVYWTGYNGGGLAYTTSLV